MASSLHSVRRMKWLAVWIVLAGLAALGTSAYATPKAAVLAIDGDASNGQLTSVVVEEANKSADVIDTDIADKGMRALGIDGVPSASQEKKLRKKLKVDVIVTGKVAKSGGKLKLTLTVTGKSNKGESVSLLFTKSSAKVFRSDLAAALKKHISAAASGTATADDDDDDDKPKSPPPKKPDDEDQPKPKHDPDAEPAKVESKPKHVARAERDRASSGDDDDGGTSIHKRHKSSLEGVQNQLTQGQIFLDGGAAGVRRALSYGVGPNDPPNVGTAGITAQAAGSYYFSDSPSAFGVIGELRQTVGVSIAVPGTTVKAPIVEATYVIGARYRLPIMGDSSIAFGANYWRQRYIANRSKLTDPNLLDMPDVDYSAVAPAVDFKYAMSNTAALYGSLTVPIVMSSGPVATSLGGKGGISFTLDAGIDFKLAPHYGLRFGALFDQVSIKFDATNAQAMARGLTTATDRTMGAIATFAVLY